MSKKLFQNELTHFSLADYLRQRRAGIRMSAQPVFIVGCGHSGTTMLLHVMGMHPRLYAVPYESRIFFHSNAKVRLADWVWSKTAIAKGKTRWVEKTPAHIHRLDQILAAYPDAKILLLIRDGRNVAVSLRKRWGDFERSVQRWVEDNRAGESYWNDPRVMKLNYEQLVADFERQIKAIFEFIGEPFDDRLLNFSKSGDEKPADNPEIDAEGVKPRELRDKQISQGLYSVEQRWMTQMTDDEKALFKKLAGQMLIEYGYASSMDW